MLNLFLPILQPVVNVRYSTVPKSRAERYRSEAELGWDCTMQWFSASHFTAELRSLNTISKDLNNIFSAYI